MISSRLPSSLAPNAVSRALDAKRKSAAVIVDLTQTNPTGAGFNYPGELLEALSNPRALDYDPQPLGLWSARGAVASDLSRPGIGPLRGGRAVGGGGGGARLGLSRQGDRPLLRSRGVGVEHERGLRIALQAAVRRRRRRVGA